jgi:hypothetical protein
MTPKVLKFTTRFNVLRNLKVNGIKPFPEKPSMETCEQDPKQTTEDYQKASLAASDLFCLFTADIIKKEVVFTR